MTYTELQRHAFRCEMAGNYAGALASYRQAYAIGENAWTESPNRATFTIGCMVGLRSNIKRLSRKLEVQS